MENYYTSDQIIDMVGYTDEPESFIFNSIIHGMESDRIDSETGEGIFTLIEVIEKICEQYVEHINDSIGKIDKIYDIIKDQ